MNCSNSPKKCSSK